MSMPPRARRRLQRALSWWDDVRADAATIRHGDPLADRFGGFGRRTVVDPPYVFLGNQNAITFGADTYVRSGLRVEALAPPGTTIVRVGSSCHIGYGVRIVAINGVTIEDEVGVGHGVTLADTVHDYKSASEGDTWKTDLKVGRPLVVGRSCWIGNNTVVAGGVHLGEGSIVNANSVISRDVPPYSLVGGNPARLWKRRDDDGVWRWEIDPATLDIDPVTDGR